LFPRATSKREPVFSVIRVGWSINCVSWNILTISLRGDFLEYRVIDAQKYRHTLRENGAICCFCENGWVKI
jgi:hypothetical protein